MANRSERIPISQSALAVQARREEERFQFDFYLGDLRWFEGVTFAVEVAAWPRRPAEQRTFLIAELTPRFSIENYDFVCRIAEGMREAVGDLRKRFTGDRG